MLGDPARCQVMLVTLPEETPVNELVETAFALEDRVGVSLGPLVVNGLVGAPTVSTSTPTTPPHDAGATLAPDDADALRQAAVFRRAVDAASAPSSNGCVERLPLPQLHLPFVFTAGIGPDRGRRPGRALAAGRHRATLAA